MLLNEDVLGQEAEDTPWGRTVKNYYHDMVVDVFKNGTYSNAHSIDAVAKLLKIRINSVFPKIPKSKTKKMYNPPIHMDTIELTSSFGVDEFRSRKDINLLWTSAVKYEHKHFHINHFVCMVDVDKKKTAPSLEISSSATKVLTSERKILHDKRHLSDDDDSDHGDCDDDDSDRADCISISSLDSEQSLGERGVEKEDVVLQDDFEGNIDLMYGGKDQKAVKPPRPSTPQFDRLPDDLKAEVAKYNKPKFRKIGIPLMIKCVMALSPEELPYDEKCGNRYVIDNSYNIIQREKKKNFKWYHSYPDDRGAYLSSNGKDVVYQRDEDNEWSVAHDVKYIKHLNCLVRNGKELDQKEHEKYLIIKVTYHKSADFPFEKKTFEFLRTPTDLKYIKHRAYVAYFGDDSMAPGPHGNRKHVSAL